MENTLKEIFKANSYIDQRLLEMNADNRASKSLEIVLAVRNLNDNVALKIFKDLYPEKNMGVNKAAGQFMGIREYRFISKFDRFLQKSVSHFTPSEDGAERLMIKYYSYLLQLKQVVYEKYGIEILSNINKFLEDLDDQTNEYYQKVSMAIEDLKRFVLPNKKDIYYVYKTKPFIKNRKIYYEVTLEPANDKSNKFNRITAFTDLKIDTYYASELNIVNGWINIFGTNIPILIISDWSISIRPCELINFSRILNIELKIQRNNSEYKSIMNLLKNEDLNLVEIVSLPEQIFDSLKQKVENNIINHFSPFFNVLKQCRNIINNNDDGANILSYLLLRMNNRVIKNQWPYPNGRQAPDLYLSTKCKPFEDHPYSFDPKEHIANFYDILYSIGSEDREDDILARYVKNNTIKNGKLYTSFKELARFGNKEKINELINKYNDSLYSGFCPKCELFNYKEYIYRFEYEQMTIDIINRLKILSNIPSDYKTRFDVSKVDILINEGKLDDPIKEKILKGMFSKSSVHLIYGSAGTGKTTLVNLVTNLMDGFNKVFLAKTNAAVVNLKQKVDNIDNKNAFLTVDKFLSREYQTLNYDMIVVDECSTVKNEDILGIMNVLGGGNLVLIGDIYQIEAIGYGNWFNIVKHIMPAYCCHELTTPFRTTDENLKRLWDSVRQMDDDNTVVEELVRNDFSLSLSDKIFIKYDEDEIVLCLNYNGLYGLNNINKLMQLSNPNPSVDIGILQYKVGDPILFNDSNRFSVLYNNLKGKIIAINDYGEYVKFKVEVGLHFDIAFGEICEGLTLESSNKEGSIVSFIVRRSLPYSSDTDTTDMEYTIPFQVSYAVSIHKSQGLEYNSVKIVIADDSENMITHNIFYTAITRAREKLMIYWSPEVCNRILNKIRPTKEEKDFNILLNKIANND